MEDIEAEDLITYSSDDSFYEIEHKENDIERIFSQWKQNDTTAPKAASTATKTDIANKFVDTRTFTRPKKKMVQNLENTFSGTIGGGAVKNGFQSPIVPINLQIGGQISTPFNMQRSWLNDVSPPGSLCTSVDMSSSLINSGDFTNVSSFLANSQVAEGETNTSLNGYGFDDLIRDRQFLDKLTNHESLNKDDSLSKTDLNSIEESGGSSSAFNKTLGNSSDNLNVTTIKVDAGGSSTFIQDGNATYRKPSSVVNDTFNTTPPPVPPVRRLSGVRNKTFDCNELPHELVTNRTFDAGSNLTYRKAPALGTTVQRQTFDVSGDLDQEVPPVLANMTFDAGVNNATFEKMVVNTTFDQAKDHTMTNGHVDELIDEVENLNLDQSNDDFASPMPIGVQSTPLQTPTAQPPTVPVNPVLDSQLSPITSRENLRNQRHHDMGILRSTKKFQDIQEILSPDGEQFDLPPLLLRQKQQQESLDYESLNDRHLSRQTIEEKRISLLTFEDMEKSILMLSNQQNEVDFDEILNTLTERRPAENDKFRQSLDLIKKRHSLINLEKQQDDLKRKETLLDATTTTTLVDNKLIDSINNSNSSMNSSGGSDRLLNRRSRLYDGVQNATMTLATSDEAVEVGGGGADVPSGQTERTAAYDRKNRDRFKTIKINKKLGEGMVVIGTEQNELDSQNDSSALNNVHTDEHSVNSVFKKPGLPAPQPPISTGDMAPKRSLSKPRFYSALPQTKKELSLPLAMKSSSSDNLDNKYSDVHVEDKPAMRSNLKSPMGVKSISYHNLVFNSNNSGNSNMAGVKSKMVAATSGPSMTQFGVTQFGRRATSVQPSAKEKQNALNMKQKTAASRSRLESNCNQQQQLEHANRQNNSNSIKSSSQTQLPTGASQLKAPTRGRPGLIRPSSGYFTYNTKRNDSDTESGRYSPNSLSSSSASSRGSLLPSEPPATLVNPLQDQLQKMAEPKTSSLPRPSGLKPPSNLRMPTARSGLPRPSFVKR